MPGRPLRTRALPGRSTLLRDHPAHDLTCDAHSEARRDRDLDAFIASFDGIRFHPALPARRQPHHPRGVASDDESIEAVSVLGRPKRSVEAAVGDAAGAEGGARPEGLESDGPEGLEIDGSEGLEADASAGRVETGAESDGQSEIDGEASRDSADAEPASEHAPFMRKRGGPSAAPSNGHASRLDRLPLPRQARHRRVPPKEHVLDITLGEYFRRLRRLAVLAQERGRAKRNGRFPRRTPMEIELALGREADDRGIAILFRELLGEGVGESAAEMAELLAGLMGTAQHFGTAIGSKAALAMEATRRGRKRVIAALRTEVRRPRGAAASGMGSGSAAGAGPGTGDGSAAGPGAGSGAGSGARGDPAVPRAG